MNLNKKNILKEINKKNTIRAPFALYFLRYTIGPHRGRGQAFGNQESGELQNITFFSFPFIFPLQNSIKRREKYEGNQIPFPWGFPKA